MDNLSPEAREARSARYRALLYRMWERSGRKQDVVAPLVGLSPKDFTRAIAPIPNPDAEQRRRFPGEELANYMLSTEREDFFFELAEDLGYDSSRLHEIRRPSKTSAQLLEEISNSLKAREKEDQQIREQLKLVMQEPGPIKGKQR